MGDRRQIPAGQFGSVLLMKKIGRIVCKASDWGDKASWERSFYLSLILMREEVKSKNHLWEIVDLFVKDGYEVTVHPTQNQLDALQVVRERACAYDLLVCSGGDGTFIETCGV